MEENCTITIRVIRSLQHKNWRPLVIRNCRLDKWTLKDLRNEIETRLCAPGSGFPPPFTRDLSYYDCIKMETNPSTNNAKSSNALINKSTTSIPFQRDSSRMDESLSSLGLSHECELSIFNSVDYETYMISNQHY